jgi:aldose 1-epimerase
MTDSDSKITLTGGGAELKLEPEKGGLIVSYRRTIGGRLVDVLHSPPKRPVNDGRHWYGCWPLVPFANRAFGGLFELGEVRFTVAINDVAGNANLHGFGWAASWDVEDRSQATATLLHERTSGSDPYRYLARQKIALDRSGDLEIEISVENRAAKALPYGLGLHPWFPCDEDTTFQAAATRGMIFGPGYRPVGSGPLAAANTWTEPRRPRTGSEQIANFLDWDGCAILRYPSRGYEIVITASDTLRFGLLWTPGSTDFVCFEPQSHALGAPSEPAAREAAPLKMLQPKEVLRGTMRIALRPA